MYQIKNTPETINLTWNRDDPFPSVPLINLQATSGSPTATNWSVVFDNSTHHWLAAEDEKITGTILFSVQQLSLQLSLNELDELTGNSYTANVFFNSYDENNPGVLSSTRVNLTIIGEAIPRHKAEKSNYVVTYNRETNQFFGDREINIEVNPDGKTLDLVATPDLFKPVSGETSLLLEENPEDPLATNSRLPESGTVEIYARLYDGQLYSLPFTITLNVIEDDSLSVSPSEVQLYVNKASASFSEAELLLSNPADKELSISAPYYLKVSESIAPQSAVITISPKDVNTLDAGTYIDEIEISTDGESITVPLRMVVSEFIFFDQKDFALDGVMLKISRIKEDGIFVKLSMEIEFSTDDDFELVETSYVAPYFEDEFSIDVGKVIHPFFPYFRDHLFGALEESGLKNKVVMHRAKVSILVEELDMDYNVLHSVEMNPFHLFPGKKPAYYPLFTDFGTRRKTERSTPILTFLENDFSGSEFVENYSPADPLQNESRVHSMIVRRGYVLREDYLRNTFGFRFIPFPKQPNAFPIQFLNQNLVPDWFVFTGRYMRDRNYDHTYEEFVEKARKHVTKSQDVLTINSGLLLKEESLIVEAIIASPVCFIMINDEVLKCFAISSKIALEDSDRNLIEHEIQFQITE